MHGTASKDRNGHRDHPVRRKVVRLYPAGPWIWDEGGDPPASPRRRWWRMWGLTAVPFFGVRSRDEGREVEKAS